MQPDLNIFLMKGTLFIKEVITRGCFITFRNSSCGKVMFSQACVKNSVHRRVCIPACTWVDTPHAYTLPDQTPPLGRHPPPPGRHPQADNPLPSTCLDTHPSVQCPSPGSHCSGRYASYVNTFLFTLVLPTRFNPVMQLELQSRILHYAG